MPRRKQNLGSRLVEVRWCAAEARMTSGGLLQEVMSRWKDRKDANPTWSGESTSRHDEQVMPKPQWAEVTVFWIQLSAWATSFQGQLLWPWGLFQLSDFCLFSLQMFIIEGQFIGLCSRLVSACLFPWMYNLFLVFCYLLFRWFYTSFGGFLRMGTD